MLHCCSDDTTKFIVKKGYPQEGVFPGIATVVFTDKALKEWKHFSSELKKGSKLNNKEAEEVIAFLANIEAKAFFIASNFQHTSENTIKIQRSDYIQSAKNACKHLLFSSRAAVIIHTRKLERMTIPDYVKAMLIIQLWENVIRGIVGNSKLYSKEDISSFNWICDIMSNKIHPTVCHFIHYQINCHSGANSIDTDDIDKIAHLINYSNSRKHLDTTRILQPINFGTDEEFSGIKAADCIANFFPRILKGKLLLSKFDGIKKLFSLSPKIELIHFDKDRPFLDVSISPYGRSLLDALQQG